MNPFQQPQFFESLLKSNCIGPEKGWAPVEFKTGEAMLRTFAKTHSYGEYIFDWGWAEAYQRMGIPYYPKLTSMVPFTPVTTKHFINANELNASKLLSEHDHFLKEGPYSGSHFLFIEETERELLKQNQYMIRESLQYHFFNEGYSDIGHYLQALKTKKAKGLLRERVFPGISIIQITGDELSDSHADLMYHFYISTIDRKHSFDYLNQEFFRNIFKSMKNQILFIKAEREGITLGASLFFYDDEKLYGRYWGMTEYVPNLHFELCYYQGIDFCLKKGLKVFEAGAQGEHKIARGFRPVIIYSAHKIKHQGFSGAIKEFIQNEMTWVRHQQTELRKSLPFKNLV